MRESRGPQLLTLGPRFRGDERTQFRIPRKRLPPLAARQEREPLEQVNVLLVLDKRAVQRGNEFLRVALAQRLGSNVLDEQELEPIEQLGGWRLLLHSRHFADLIEQLERFRYEALLDTGEVHIDNCAHGVGIGKPDVVEKAAPQKRVR